MACPTIGRTQYAEKGELADMGWKLTLTLNLIRRHGNVSGEVASLGTTLSNLAPGYQLAVNFDALNGR